MDFCQRPSNSSSQHFKYFITIVTQNPKIQCGISLAEYKLHEGKDMCFLLVFLAPNTVPNTQ